MMLSGCGYPHGTTGNRSEREINPLQVSDLEWLARTGQCGVIDLALLAFHIKWNDQLGGAYAFLSGWNVLPAFFICSEIYITISMKVRNENFIDWVDMVMMSKSKNNFRDFGEGYFHDQYHTQQDLNNVDV